MYGENRAAVEHQRTRFIRKWNATVQVRRFEAGGRVPEHNQRLARPLASKLQTWLALGFFGL